MKIIDIPAETIKDVPVRIVADGIINNEKITMPFPEFIQLSLDAYEPLGTGGKAGRQARKLADLLADINGEKVIRLEDADYEVVEQAVETMKWHSAANAMISAPKGYREAVEKAQTVEDSKAKLPETEPAVEEK